MTSTITDKPQSIKEIAFSVSWEDWAKEMEAAVEHFRAHVKTQGFRKGKAPREVVEREVGRDALVAEAAERTVRKTYAAAVREHDLRVVAAPEVRMTKVAEGNPLEFTVSVAVVPTMTLKKGWREAVAAANTAAVGAAPVEDAAIDEEIAKLARARATTATVDRPAAMDDVAIVDFVVSVDGVPIEGGTGKGHPLVLGSGAFIPGFEEAVVGMTAGESKTVELAFPDKYHAAHLAGKPASFAITLVRVEARTVPTIDDAFAASLGKFASLADLQKSIRDGLTAEAAERATAARRDAVMEALADQVEVDLPQAMVDRELARMEEYFGQQFAGSGMGIDDILEKAGKTRDDLHTEWTPQARKRAITGLALEHVADAVEITAPTERVEEEMNALMARLGGATRKDLDLARLHEAARDMVRQEEVLRYLENIK